MGLSSESHPYAAATRASTSLITAPPLSVLVMTITPYPFRTCATRSQRKPQLLPPWLTYQPSPRLSTTNPTANSPTPTGVTISRAPSHATGHGQRPREVPAEFR